MPLTNYIPIINGAVLSACWHHSAVNSLQRDACFVLYNVNYYLISKSVVSIFQAVKTRFAPVMDNRDALLAAVTLPKFKVRWLKEESEDRREALKVCGDTIL